MLHLDELASCHQEGPKIFGSCEAWLSADGLGGNSMRVLEAGEWGCMASPDLAGAMNG